MNSYPWEQSDTGEWQATIPESIIDEYIDCSQWLRQHYSSSFQSWNSCCLIESEIRTGNKRRTIYKRGLGSFDFHKFVLPYLYRKYLDLLVPHNTITSMLDKTRANEQVWEKLHEYTPYAHGFVPKKSCITQAKQHIGFKYTISLDIKDFFDSIKPDLVQGIIPEELIPYLFVNGSARQGLSSSPILSNIAFHQIDVAINEFLSSYFRFGGDSQRDGIDDFLSGTWPTAAPFSYTRYADDISVSLNNDELIDTIINNICMIIERHGLRINVKKTKIQSYLTGRRIICGIGVDKTDIHPTRKTMKKLRAATHQKNFASLIGLYTWVNSIK